MALTSVIITSCLVISILIISYGYLWLTERKPALFAWIFSLALILLAYLSRIYMLSLGYEPPMLQIINFAGTILGYLLLFKGLHMFFKRSHSLAWDIIAVVLVVLFVFFTVLADSRLPKEPLLILSMLFAIGLWIKAGLTCLAAAKPKGTLKRILACTFFLWAAALILYPLCYILRTVPLYYGYLVTGLFGFTTFLCIQVIYFQNIREELENKKENISKLLLYDHLTGAYSRAYFEQEGRELLQKYPLPITLAIGDVNGLKLVNDTFGHQKGDELLLDAVDIIKNTIGKDNLVVRWGGDEFVIVMPGLSLPAAETLLKKVKMNFRRFPGKTIPLDISFGLAAFKNKQQPIGEVIQQAEEKMYSNKLTESKKTRMEMIGFLEKLLWQKDYHTEEHVMRLKRLVGMMASRLGLSARETAELKLVAVLHDIGKIGVPGEILRKSGDLTPEEWAVMKKHTEIGYRITQASRELAHISEFILHHHEWWNGGGYPLGLKGEEIPLYSRIVAIADAYDVMTHDRPYYKAMEPIEVLEELVSCAGTQFDPHLVKVFYEMMLESVRTMPGREGRDFSRIKLSMV